MFARGKCKLIFLLLATVQKLLLLCSIYFLFGEATAQNIAAYNDYRNFLIAFDSGINQQVEHNKVQSFKIGGTMVAWVDYLGNFKVFYQGETQMMENVPIGIYQPTDYLIAYTLGFGSVLSVVDAGKMRRLTVNAKYYTIADSIITFYDKQTQSYKAYYKGGITELDYVEDDPQKDEKVSDNVVGFISRNGEFRVFWQGMVYPILFYNGTITYEAGKNIVPFIDPYTSTLKAFYKGQTFEIEQNKPLSFKTGDDMVAYETNDWTFNVFYDGKITKLSSYQPKFYDVTDSLVIYQEFNTFKVFYKGSIQTLETNYIPKYTADFSTLVYFDVQNRLTIFSSGKKTIVSYEPVTSYTLYRNTLHYRVNNTDFVYWMGRRL